MCWYLSSSSPSPSPSFPFPSTPYHYHNFIIHPLPFSPSILSIPQQWPSKKQENAIPFTKEFLLFQKEQGWRGERREGGVVWELGRFVLFLILFIYLFVCLFVYLFILFIFFLFRWKPTHRTKHNKVYTPFDMLELFCFDGMDNKVSTHTHLYKNTDIVNS